MRWMRQTEPLRCAGLAMAAVVAGQLLAPACLAASDPSPIGSREGHPGETDISPAGGTSLFDDTTNTRWPFPPSACHVMHYNRSHFERRYREIATSIKPGYNPDGVPRDLEPNGLYPNCQPPLYTSRQPMARRQRGALAGCRAALEPALRALVEAGPRDIAPDSVAITRDGIVAALHQASIAGEAPPIDELCADPTRPDALVLDQRRYGLFFVSASGTARPAFSPRERVTCADLDATPVLSTVGPAAEAIPCPPMEFDVNQAIARIRELGETRYGGQVREEDLWRFDIDAIHELINRSNRCELPPIQACLRNGGQDSTNNARYIVVNGWGIYTTGTMELETADEKDRLDRRMVDYDVDGVPNDRDNCPCDDNPNQADADHDRYGDACDTPLPKGDAPVQVTPNVLWANGCAARPLPACCALVPPPIDCSDRWEDAGKKPSCFVRMCGTSCAPVGRRERDSDPDRDGLPACRDNCQRVKNPSQEDRDHDTVGAACDCDDTTAEERTLVHGKRSDGLGTLETKPLTSRQCGTIDGSGTAASANLFGLEYYLNHDVWNAGEGSWNTVGGTTPYCTGGGRGLAFTFRISSTVGWSDPVVEKTWSNWAPNPPLTLLPNGCADDCPEHTDWRLDFGTDADTELDFNGTLPGAAVPIPGFTEGSFCR